MRPTINTEKHYVQQSLGSVAAGAITPISVAFAVATHPSSVSEVREGAKISAVYIEMWINSSVTLAGSGILTLEKRTGNMVAMTAAQSTVLDAYVNKKNVLHTFMGLVPGDETMPMPAIRGWFKIPKGKQRFGLQDILVLNIHGQGSAIDFCGFFVYKEQY